MSAERKRPTKNHATKRQQNPVSAYTRPEEKLATGRNAREILHKHALYRHNIRWIYLLYANPVPSTTGGTLIAACFRPVRSLLPTCRKHARNLLRPEPRPVESIPDNFWALFPAPKTPVFLSIFRYHPDTLPYNYYALQNSETTPPPGRNKPFSHGLPDKVSFCKAAEKSGPNISRSRTIHYFCSLKRN